MRLIRASFVVLVLLFVAPYASAQTVLNPSTMSFTASADHDTTFEGTDILTRYDLQVRTSADPGVVVQTYDLGKPMPDAMNVIMAAVPDFSALMTLTSYVAAVASVGPGGESAGGLSVPFALVAAPGAPGTPTFLEAP